MNNDDIDSMKSSIYSNNDSNVLYLDKWYDKVDKKK
jgi:hypothetical protein